MAFRFSPGDIFQARFPFEEDISKFKERPVFIWRIHGNKPVVLVSKITGSAGRSKWEIALRPSTRNGLVKPCVIRIDQTKYIPISSILFQRGVLGPFEISAAQKLFMKYKNSLEGKY
jgi:hypothetical protein